MEGLEWTAVTNLRLPVGALGTPHNVALLCSKSTHWHAHRVAWSCGPRLLPSWARLLVVDRAQALPLSRVLCSLRPPLTLLAQAQHPGETTALFCFPAVCQARCQQVSSSSPGSDSMSFVENTSHPGNMLHQVDTEEVSRATQAHWSGLPHMPGRPPPPREFKHAPCTCTPWLSLRLPLG